MTARSKNGDGAAKRVVVRCAIYTRKSTEEGLQQEFNSLDAQREACEAYIVSQKAEGWVLLLDRYDDGGFSGGTTDRPALRRLLADIAAKKVDCVVVYKVDRWSRSILDFTQMMARFEADGVSFVSVTQDFNTATPMGRLILHLLLSFAQFERELGSERTRDKMSAARRRGRWTGGVPLLGYDIDPKGGKIHVNKAEAKRVRAVFQLYLEKQSVLETVTELNRRGLTTKSWTTRHGTVRPGSPWSKNTLITLLKSRTYTGEIEFQGQVYPGEQEAIVDRETWDRVQEILRRNGSSCGSAVRNKYGALLPGILYCAACGSRMTSTHTQKKQRRYRYYQCARVVKLGRDACPTPALPAGEIERFVVERIKGIGRDPELIAQVRAQTPPPHEGLEEALAEFYTVWEALTPHEQARVVQLVIERVTYDAPAGTITFAFRPNGIRTLAEEMPQ